MSRNDASGAEAGFALFQGRSSRRPYRLARPVRTHRTPTLGRLVALAFGAVLATAGCAASSTATPSVRPTLPAIQSAVVCPAAPAHAAVVNPPRHFDSPPGAVISVTSGYCAYLATASGVISIRLRPEFAPNTVNDFVFLAQRGFYDGLSFFEACPDTTDMRCPASASIAVAGDPTESGSGGPGYTVAAEPVIGDYLLGAVAMYGADPAKSGSEFLISKGDSRSLPHRYVIFGQVTDGIPALASLSKGAKILWVAVQATAQEP
jgi:cyclophilin family peptidyl-prolyl cis-trans isomerase